MTNALHFVDCSSNNPLPNLPAYKAAGHREICRKVSEGVGYHWLEGDGVTARAHNLGLHVGHYHWLREDSNATAQAAFFVGLVKPHLKAGDWLLTDFEQTAGVHTPADVVRAAQLHEFNAYVSKHLPDYPLYVYTGNWYLDGKPHCQAECRRRPVIMSDYSGASSLPNPYSLHYVAWQFTDRANVAGFGAPVDYNRRLVPAVPPVKEFTMTPAEESKIRAMIDARADVSDKATAAHIDKAFATLKADLDNLALGHDGKPHRIETLATMGARNTTAAAAQAQYNAHPDVPK